VGEGHRFFVPISWLAGAGITTGYEGGTFRPSAPVTRQSTAAFLYRMAGEPDAPEDPPTFSDVSVEHPFHAEITWLAGVGITTGYVDGTFRGGQVVTRQAMAAFLHRFDQLPDPPEPGPIVLGNPDNVLGYDPIAQTGQPRTWLNVGGRAATKISGDRYTNGVCGSGAAGVITGCSSTTGY
ncbi:hypothetical protein B7486_76755, partial [cyanobacterium TDX16]